MPAGSPTKQSDPAPACSVHELLRARRLTLIARLAEALKLTYRLSMHQHDEGAHAVVERLADRIMAMADDLPGDPLQIEREFTAAESVLGAARTLHEKLSSGGPAAAAPSDI